MSRILRVIGGLNVLGGAVLAFVFQMLTVSATDVALAQYAHRPPPVGLDGATATILSISMLFSGAIGCLLFFAIARILDRVEEVHWAVIVAPKAE